MNRNIPLINKYRPASFAEVLGHEEILAALQRVLKSPTCPHAYLFTGPSGTGKTTIARIVASELGSEVIEVDAASNSGIDSIRSLIELGQHQSIFGAASKMFIIDEAHGLSRSAFQALLKILEEPPAHLYIALATTELQKIPETILTRCYHIPLRAIKDREIEALLSLVCEFEGWNVINDVLQAVVLGATGQPRKALSLLQSCYDAPSREEAKRIISLLEDSEPLIDLARQLMSGKRSWTLIQPLLARIDESDFEDASILVGRYLMAGIFKEEHEDKARMYWQLLDALLFPTSGFDKKASFIDAVGKMLWGGQ